MGPKGTAALLQALFSLPDLRRSVCGRFTSNQRCKEARRPLRQLKDFHPPQYRFRRIGQLGIPLSKSLRHIRGAQRSLSICPNEPCGEVCFPDLNAAVPFPMRHAHHEMGVAVRDHRECQFRLKIIDRDHHGSILPNSAFTD